MDNPNLFTIHITIGEEIVKFFPKESIVAIGFTEFDDQGDPQQPAGIIYDKEENGDPDERSFSRVGSVILSTKRGCAPESDIPALTLEIKNSDGDVYGLISVLVYADHFGEADTGVPECEIREHVLTYLKSEGVRVGEVYGNLYY
ncbi:MAG: hypothetical protein MJ154_02000 [Candidatus Saccharibacteria bacterium]|nr:hypothetical protein [Candidatus Saccharibacteria bacterium]